MSQRIHPPKRRIACDRQIPRYTFANGASIGAGMAKCYARDTGDLIFVQCIPLEPCPGRTFE
jgi:hypothetical protein